MLTTGLDHSQGNPTQVYFPPQASMTFTWACPSLTTVRTARMDVRGGQKKGGLGMISIVLRMLCKVNLFRLPWRLSIELSISSTFWRISSIWVQSFAGEHQRKVQGPNRRPCAAWFSNWICGWSVQVFDYAKHSELLRWTWIRGAGDVKPTIADGAIKLWVHSLQLWALWKPWAVLLAGSEKLI